jgi:hypothetical protein
MWDSRKSRLSRRLLDIEARHHRRQARAYADATGYSYLSTEAILEENVRWLSLPIPAMQAERPEFSASECAELKRLRPALQHALRPRMRQG